MVRRLFPLSTWDLACRQKRQLSSLNLKLLWTLSRKCRARRVQVADVGKLLDASLLILLGTNVALGRSSAVPIGITRCSNEKKSSRS